jgi:small conductance mechanosensitive channel
MNESVQQANQKIQESVQMAQKMWDMAAEYLVKYGFQVLGGLILLLIGYWMASHIASLFFKFTQKRKWDITLSKLLASFLKIIILIFVVMMSAEKFGITIAPLVAAASALIFGTSFALQAPLSNYAAGLMVIVTRPFVIGNTIQVQGVSGVVEEIKLPCTILVNEDGEKIVIPNKEIVGQILWNSAEHKVVEKTVGISYNNDPEAAIAVIVGVLKQIPKVTQQPAPIIGIESFGESAIVISLRYWVPTKEYFLVMHQANLAIYKALKESKITIPYPQREIRMIPS